MSSHDLSHASVFLFSQKREVLYQLGAECPKSRVFLNVDRGCMLGSSATSLGRGVKSSRVLKLVAARFIPPGVQVVVVYLYTLA